ncbi:putative ATP/GTP-binding protein [Leptolyngbya boryana NIES-2135]|jgi:MinD-like ATPase involved in chromosome partitioning or flagellar assembly|uniref:Putative ATP/GTP-binding protein n=1 Tax=Leptolyngbya boryana NIES-2135 TaxID=1973484 RepID=A0A1Z4JIF9_LEPBY|nr:MULTISPECIES: TIR domain-containing protein [Leptolyngbya]BAY56443.1 putative ATP/GTP-binding protein [Leptolyngbya boryana NIES-2135]MBD2366546.1 TIR domain-containing protein [Leptolyngbya sp. FACHB-161]MBD2372725.1 TIR domain-containing protein [Leptolyngbya sp. FACHB-238]MBD2397149.1 TIR domain-containing protein [Leptolyngbya sp. FACHB-239]MBD2403672.1 TIR domain-containing protein [Leptolyngbya sp. FACHB-402]
MNKGNIVTFYSYKGGVGRTFALASIGVLLAQWGFKVLCIDWDLEAPGLHLYFSPWIKDPNQSGLTELIQAHVNEENPRWQDFVTTVDLPDAQHPLSLVTAGLQNDSYLQRMQQLDWDALYQAEDLGIFLEELREDWKQQFDFVLIDSRTGITDIGGICTIQMPDFLVLLFTANVQSLYGAIDVAQRAKRLRDLLPFDRSKLLVLPVVTRFESRVEYELAQEWLEIFSTQLAPLFEDWISREVTTSELLNFTKIPYVPYWSFGEKIPVIEEGTKDLESIGFTLETLAALLGGELGETEQLVKNRSSYINRIQQVQNTAIISKSPPKNDLRLFFSYSHRDEELAKELMVHLQALKRRGIIDTWHDREITPGSTWLREIDEQMNEADLILLLISPSFLASDYPYEKEIEQAIMRHQRGEAVVIPIIVRPVDWQASPFANLQALPRNAQPITTWSDQDEAFLNISMGIRKAAEHLITRKSKI